MLKVSKSVNVDYIEEFDPRTRFIKIPIKNLPPGGYNYFEPADRFKAVEREGTSDLPQRLRRESHMKSIEFTLRSLFGFRPDL